MRTYRMAAVGLCLAATPAAATVYSIHVDGQVTGADGGDSSRLDAFETLTHNGGTSSFFTLPDPAFDFVLDTDTPGATIGPDGMSGTGSASPLHMTGGLGFYTLVGGNLSSAISYAIEGTGSVLHLVTQGYDDTYSYAMTLDLHFADGAACTSFTCLFDSDATTITGTGHGGFYLGTPVQLAGFTYRVREASSSIQAAAVPEPAGWTAMIMGFGAIGGALRRRTHATFAKAAA